MNTSDVGPRWRTEGATQVSKLVAPTCKIDLLRTRFFLLCSPQTVACKMCRVADAL